MSDQKRPVSSQLANITQHNISRLQIWHARRANTTQLTPSTATSGQSEKQYCQYSHFWQGLCQEAFDPSEPSNKIRCLCTDWTLHHSSSSRYSRSTMVPDGHQLGKCTKLHLSLATTGAPEKHGKEASIQSCRAHA